MNVQLGSHVAEASEYIFFQETANVGVYDVFKKFATYAGQGNWPVIS